MAFTPELILGIIGTVTGIIGLVTAIYFNREAIKQTDRNLKTQLIYEDKKRALIELQYILNKEMPFPKFTERIRSFLDSPNGQFIPDDIKKDLRDGIYEIEEFEDENAPYPTARKEAEEMSKAHENEPEEVKDPIETFEEEFGQRIDSLKSSIKYKINTTLKEF